MNQYIFWKNWNTPFKQLYNFLLFVFILSIVAVFYGLYAGGTHVIKWDVETELEPVKIVLDQFHKNIFTFSYETNGYYALDKYITTEVQPNEWLGIFHFGLIVLAIIFILTAISYFEIYWFMGGTLLVLFFLSSLKLDLLQLFGRIDGIPMFAIFLILSLLSFLFNSFFKTVSFLARILSFTLVFILVGIIIFKFSTVEKPIFYLANFSSLFPVCISILFVFLIGYDIIKALLFVFSGPKTSGTKNNYFNFIFASMLYLANVLLVLLKELYIIDLNIFYINPFFLLIISSILGIYFFKKRSELFSKSIPFVPIGAFLYLSLGIITFSGISYAFLNANEGMIEIYEKIILYGHLFLGGIFFLYVLLNFTYLFDKKVSVYEVVYQPKRLTYFIVPTVAIAASTFFFLYQKKYPYHQAMAGYYCYAGDVMVFEKDYPLAFQYYQKAVTYDYPNHRANYAIASLSASLQNKQVSKGYFENALYRNPTVDSYIGLSNVYVETGELYKAIFNLQEGITKYPEDGRLYNNLAYLFYKSNIPDSAIHYFLKAKDLVKNKEVPYSNVIYMMAKSNLFEDADSLMKIESYPNHISFANNKLAISNQLNQRSNDPFKKEWVKDSVLNANSFAYLINSNLNTIQDTSTFILKLLTEKALVKENEPFRERLELNKALKYYFTDKKLEAFLALNQLDYSASSTNFDYAALLGILAIENDRFDLASELFLKASKGGDLNTQLNYTIASTYNRDIENALYILNQLVKAPKAEIKSPAEKLVEVLTCKNANDALKLTESQRLQYFTIVKSSTPISTLENIFKSFENEQAKIYAGIQLCQIYLDQNVIEKAEKLFGEISSIPTHTVFLKNDLNFIHLQIKLAKGDTASLIKTVPSIDLNIDQEKFRAYFIAKTAQLVNDSINATSFYLNVLNNMPYHEMYTREAAFYLMDKFPQETYNALINILVINPSIQNQITYFYICLKIGLISYAESTLEELKKSLPNKEFAILQEQFIRHFNESE